MLFKIGDRVRIISEGNGLDTSGWVGMEGVVTKESDPKWGNTRAKFEGTRPDGLENDDFFWNTARLELVPPKRDFVVGDHVRIVRIGNVASGDWVGMRGVVTEVPTTGMHLGQVRAQFEGTRPDGHNSVMNFYWDIDKMELITSETDNGR